MTTADHRDPDDARRPPARRRRPQHPGLPGHREPGRRGRAARRRQDDGSSLQRRPRYADAVLCPRRLPRRTRPRPTHRSALLTVDQRPRPAPAAPSAATRSPSPAASSRDRPATATAAPRCATWSPLDLNFVLLARPGARTRRRPSAVRVPLEQFRSHAHRPQPRLPAALGRARQRLPPGRAAPSGRRPRHRHPTGRPASASRSPGCTPDRRRDPVGRPAAARTSRLIAFPRAGPRPRPSSASCCAAGCTPALLTPCRLARVPRDLHRDRRPGLGRALRVVRRQRHPGRRRPRPARRRHARARPAPPARWSTTYAASAPAR